MSTKLAAFLLFITGAFTVAVYALAHSPRTPRRVRLRDWLWRG